MKIDQSLNSLSDLTGNIQAKKNSANSESKPFSKMLIESIEKVNDLQKQADKSIDELVVGDNKDIVQTMITMEKADVSFRLMMQIRNKILQAYEEVMRTQV